MKQRWSAPRCDPKTLQQNEATIRAYAKEVDRLRLELADLRARLAVKSTQKMNVKEETELTLVRGDRKMKWETNMSLATGKPFFDLADVAKKITGGGK